MPFDCDAHRIGPRLTLRAAMLDLISREAGNPTLDDAGMQAALRMIIFRSRDAADDLWDKYRGGRCLDTGARVAARFHD